MDGARPQRASGLRESQTADAGKLQARRIQVEAEGEAKQIHFETFFPTPEHAHEAVHGRLDAGAAGRTREDCTLRQVVLPDGRRRQIEPQFGNRPPDVRALQDRLWMRGFLSSAHYEAERVDPLTSGPIDHAVVPQTAAALALVSQLRGPINLTASV